MTIRDYLDRRFYPAQGKNWDDELFRSRVLSLLQPTWRALDLGAGAGLVKQMNFRGLVAQVCGADLDPRVLQNPMLDLGVLRDVGATGFPDGSFDLVFADNLMEHIAEPEVVLAEVFRVLKPGGYFLFKTPNSLHYMPVISRVTPLWFHRAINRARGRDSSDTFPTLYRINSKRVVTELARRSGFEVEAVDRVEAVPSI